MLYSLDLQINYCDEWKKDEPHFVNTFNLWRKSYNECLIIIKALWIKNYCFLKRPKKFNYFQLKYWNTERMVDACVLYVYVGEE